MAIATQSTGEKEINDLNFSMRQTPWYQEFFRTRGLDPNKVKLNDNQRQALTTLAKANGFQLGDRMKFDEAGNMNQKGGWAGMSPAMKAIIIAAAAAGTGGAAMLAAGGGAGVGAGGLGSGLAAAGGAPTAASTGMGLGMGTGGFIGAGGAAAGGAAAIPTLGSTALTTGLGSAPSIGGAAGGGSSLAGTAAKGGGSVISKLLGGNNTQNFADAGSMLGNIAESEAANRLGKYNMALGHGNLSLSAQQDRRTQESDAMKKIQQAGYIKSGGSPFDASSVKLAGGRELPSFSFPRAPITDEAKQAAGMLEADMLKRLGPGGSYAPPNLEDFTNRGGLESATNYGSMAAGGLGALNKFGLLDDAGRGLASAGKWIGSLF